MSSEGRKKSVRCSKRSTSSKNNKPRDPAPFKPEPIPAPTPATDDTRQLSVLDKVQAITHRHNNGYYVDWSEERLQNLPPGYRQRFGGADSLTPRLPSKTERRDNKMLAWAYKNSPQFVLV